jgi:23S rRNA (uracil1939-C5)-methyltransferase
VPEVNSALKELRDVVSSNPDIVGGDGAITDVNIAAGDSSVSFEPAFCGLSRRALSRRVAGFNFGFNPETFFQVNPSMLETLILEAIGADTGALAIDLYAGVGFFTLPLARKYHSVVGVEADRSSALFASANVETNNIANAEIYQAGAAEWLERHNKRGKLPPDLILLDPPRTGAAAAIPQIIAAKPERITYVSCDPTTLARDLRRLLDRGYQLRNVVALDLFPQTYHVESVACLERLL